MEQKLFMRKEKISQFQLKIFFQKLQERPKLFFWPIQTIQQEHRLVTRIITFKKKLRSNILLVVDDAYFEYVKDKNYFSGIRYFQILKMLLLQEHFQNYMACGFRLDGDMDQRN